MPVYDFDVSREKNCLSNTEVLRFGIFWLFFYSFQLDTFGTYVIDIYPANVYLKKTCFHTGMRNQWCDLYIAKGFAGLR